MHHNWKTILVTLCFGLIACEESEPESINHYPVISAVTVAGGGVMLGDTAQIYCEALDEDLDSLVYIWTASTGELLGEGTSVAWVPPDYAAQYPLHVRVEDGKGGFTEREFNIQVHGLGNQTWQIYSTQNSEIQRDYTLTIATGNGNAVWLGNEFGNITRFENDTWTTWEVAQGEITDLAIDNSDNAWFISDGGPAKKFDGVDVQHYPETSYAEAIAIDANNHIWVATRQGLYHGEGVSFVPYDTSGAWHASLDIRALSCADDGSVWATGYENGTATPHVFRFQDHSYTSYVLNSPFTPHGKSIATANELVWISHWNGISRYLNGTFTYFESPDPEITSLSGLAVDGRGHVWAGANNALLKFDGTQWTVLTGPGNEIAASWATDIAIDEGGNKWIGLYKLSDKGGGVAVYNELGIH